MKASTLAIVSASSILLTVGCVLLFFAFYAVYQVYDIKMELDIGNTSAFSVNPDRLDFGKASPGGSNTRTIVLAHDYPKPLLVSFRQTGNITGFVVLPERFYLEPGVSKEVSFTAVSPKGSLPGRYEGTLRVYYRRI